MPIKLGRDDIWALIKRALETEHPGWTFVRFSDRQWTMMDEAGRAVYSVELADLHPN